MHSPLAEMGSIACISFAKTGMHRRHPPAHSMLVPPLQQPGRTARTATRKADPAPRHVPTHAAHGRSAEAAHGAAARMRGKAAREGGGGGGGKRGGGGRGVRAAAGRRARRALRVGGGGRFNPPLPGGGGGGISIQAALREPGAPGALWDWAGSPVRGRRRRARRRRAGKRETWGGREGVRERGGARRGDLKGNSPPPSRRRTAGP